MRRGPKPAKSKEAKPPVRLETARQDPTLSTLEKLAKALRVRVGRVTGARDVTETGYRPAHLDRYLKGRRLAAIGTRDSEPYALRQQGQGASNESINRELAVLGRMRKQACEHNRLARMPVLRKLEESAPRQGFLEGGRVCRRAAPAAGGQVAVSIAYVYGWRTQSEVLALEQRQLDLEGKTLTLDPGQTKNGRGARGGTHARPGAAADGASGARESPRAPPEAHHSVAVPPPVGALHGPAPARFPESVGDGVQEGGVCPACCATICDGPLSGTWSRPRCRARWR